MSLAKIDKRKKLPADEKASFEAMIRNAFLTTSLPISVAGTESILSFDIEKVTITLKHGRRKKAHNEEETATN